MPIVRKQRRVYRITEIEEAESASMPDSKRYTNVAIGSELEAMIEEAIEQQIIRNSKKRGK